MTTKSWTKESGQILAVLLQLCLVCLNSLITDFAFKAFLRKEGLTKLYVDMLSHVLGEQHFEGEKSGAKSYLLFFLLQQKLFIIKLTIIPICYLCQGQWNECICSEDRTPAFNAMQKVFKHSVNYNNNSYFLVVLKKNKWNLWFSPDTAELEMWT